MTIVATPGPTANSYVTQEETLSYVNERTHLSAWTKLISSVQQQNLHLASKLLSQLPWRGNLTNEGDALRWPRSGLYDMDQHAIADDVYPVFLKEACIEYAVALSQETLLEDTDNKSSVKVGSIQINYDKPAGKPTLPPMARILISSYIYPPAYELVR